MPDKTWQTVASYTRGLQKAPQAWLDELVRAAYPTPFMMLDLCQARTNAEHIRKLLPRVSLYYAVKANIDPRLTHALADVVDGFEIASAGEGNELIGQGVQPARLIYSNPVKAPMHIQMMYGAGVRRFAFDGLGELEKLARHAPGASVYLRVRVSDSGSVFPLSRKFGADPEQVVAYMRAAKGFGLDPIGLTFHVGSQSENASSWSEALSLCGALIGKLARAGLPISWLNIGGGLPAPYTFTAFSLRKVTAVINVALQAYIPSSVSVVAEPGRAISASAGMIVATVIGRETRGNEVWLFVDMGAFQGLIEPLEAPGWHYPILTDYQGAPERLQRFIVTGPTCDPSDTIGEYYLPARLKLGDRIYIGSAGAYTHVYGSTFNGFALPRVHYITKKGVGFGRISP